MGLVRATDDSCNNAAGHPDGLGWMRHNAGLQSGPCSTRRCDGVVVLGSDRRLDTRPERPAGRAAAVRLEFVVRPPLGAEPSPGSGKPNGHCSVRHEPPSGRRRRSMACGPSTTRGCVPRCRRPGSRQVSVQDHGHSKTAHGREILAASFRSGAPRATLPKILARARALATHRDVQALLPRNAPSQTIGGAPHA